MTRLAIALCVLAASTPCLQAQIAGNSAYGQASAKATAELQERSQRTLTAQDLPPNPNSMFLEASILANVKPDHYIAVFGIAEQGPTVKDASDRMDTTLLKFSGALATLQIPPADIFVDSIAEPRVYEYKTDKNVAKERQTGFELKKNLSVRFTSYATLDKLTLAAADSGIYDLIRVEYVVTDTAAVQKQLRAEAAKVIHQKLLSDQSLLGIHVKPSPAIYAERSAIHYPTQLYDSYTAAESEPTPYRGNLSVEPARKTRTFYYNPLDASGFDKVLNPSPVDPEVQFTFYLKLKYDIAH